MWIEYKMEKEIVKDEKEREVERLQIKEKQTFYHK